MQEPVDRTQTYVRQLWNEVLLRSALELRKTLALLPDESRQDNPYAREMLVMLEVLEDEVMRRGFGPRYLRTLISRVDSMDDTELATALKNRIS